MHNDFKTFNSQVWFRKVTEKIWFTLDIKALFPCTFRQFIGRYFLSLILKYTKLYWDILKQAKKIVHTWDTKSLLTDADSSTNIFSASINKGADSFFLPFHNPPLPPPSPNTCKMYFFYMTRFLGWKCIFQQKYLKHRIALHFSKLLHKKTWQNT